MIAKNIIIVEDDKMLYTLFDMLISSLGHKLQGTFRNGKDCIEACKKQKPDLVLMDIHIQGEIDGIQTAKIIQENHNIPIVFLSSDNEEETIKKAMLINSLGFLVKPVKRIILKATIEISEIKSLYHKNLDKENFSFLNEKEYGIIVLKEKNIIYLNDKINNILETKSKNEISGKKIDCIETTPSYIDDYIDYLVGNPIKIKYLLSEIKISDEKTKEIEIVGTTLVSKTESYILLLLYEKV